MANNNSPAGGPARSHQQQLLMIALEVAVPLWIARARATPIEQRAARALVLASQLGSHGDAIEHHISGRTAEACNALAESLALLSLAPGGVTYHGRHWQTSTTPPSKGVAA
jgi:hypothetical protein